ncbi:MAG: hypothetical protein WA985_02605 [Erythrobacter sp.]|uniref:hypothetical protein n=1 Tax=Erythrobacter sp. TaxID=1042 RepID=UPI003C73CF78
MSGWAFVAVVAIVVWGIVQLSRARGGITSDRSGKVVQSGQDASAEDRARAQAEAEETRREIEQLRERLQVLERIATDNNSEDARERARIAAEIEALRDTNPPAKQAEPASLADDTRKEPNQ